MSGVVVWGGSWGELASNNPMRLSGERLTAQLPVVKPNQNKWESQRRNNFEPLGGQPEFTFIRGIV